MAVLLDGNRLVSQTRTQRLVQAVTLEAVLRYAPMASIAGVPLAIIAAREYSLGYASRLGIPIDFVRAEPTAAFVPFVIITAVLLGTLLVLHEVERMGVAQAMKTWGGNARLFLFIAALGFYIGSALVSPDQIPVLATGALMLYMLLWWLPRLIGWIWKHALGEVRTSRPGEATGRLWNSAVPTALRKLLLGLIVLVSIVTVPWQLGVWTAMTKTQYAVIDRGKNHTEVILDVYGDKAFIGWVEDDTAVARVEMVAVSDLENKPIWIQDIGPLRFVEGN